MAVVSIGKDSTGNRSWRSPRTAVAAVDNGVFGELIQDLLFGISTGMFVVVIIAIRTLGS